MSLEAEVLVDRRRLQRRLSFWRLGAILFALVAVVAFLAGNKKFGLHKSDQIARIEISGIITDDRKQQKMLEELAKADHVKAVLMHVNSPGGTTTGGEALFAALRRLSDKKPVVAVFGTVAASAAYIAGLASDRIISRGNTITGSVGVIFQFANVSDLLEKIGVKVEEVKSGRLKASPSPFQPADQAGKELAQEMVMEAQGWFLGLVKDRRKMSDLQIDNLKDGRIFSGRQALEFGLVDDIGGEREAIKWLEEKKKVSKELPVIKWEPSYDNNLGWFSAVASSVETALGIPKGTISALASKTRLLDRLPLDGLVSIWHPISRR